MKVKINEYSYEIPPISKLSVLQYMQIIDKVRYTDLVSYISALSGLDIDNAEVDIKNINAAERYLLDVENVVEFDKLKVPNMYGDKIVKDLYKENFGAKYVFNLYRNSYNADNIGIIELCVYALAIMVSEKDGLEDVESIYQDLLGENWMVVVPVGFFISKRLKERNRYLMTFLMKLIYRFSSRLKKPRKAVGMLTT